MSNRRLRERQSEKEIEKNGSLIFKVKMLAKKLFIGAQPTYSFA
jgi:hypothetical protein